MSKQYPAAAFAAANIAPAFETAPLLSSKRTCYTDKEKARAAVLAQFDAMSDDCVKAEVAELGSCHECNADIINKGEIEEGKDWYYRLMADAQKRRQPTPGGNWLDGDEETYEQMAAL